MEKHLKPYQIDVNSVGFFVDRLLFAMIKRRNHDLNEINSDLQHAEFVVLKVINILKGASQSQLAAVMGKERSGIGRILTSLEKKGYIERVPLNGSTNHVTLTEKGEQTIPMIMQLSEKLTEQTFKGFSKKGRESIIENLDKMYRNVLLDEK